jgi:soluble lytic murein transglycosylase-like protein
MSRIRHIVSRSPRSLRSPVRASSLGTAAVLGLALGLGCLAAVEPDVPSPPASTEPDTEPDTEPTVLAVDAVDASTELVDDAALAGVPERVAMHAPAIVEAAERHGVDPSLVAIIVQVESGWDPRARSPIGARGLMQVMPQTAARIAAERGLDGHTEARLDEPTYNLDLGTWYLARQLETFGPGLPEDAAVSLAAAAYNAGPERLQAALAGEAELGEETRLYRARVEALWAARNAPIPAP